MLPELFQSIQWLQQRSTQRRNLRYWQTHGRIPWQRGYIESKEAAIRRSLQDPATRQLFSKHEALPEHYGERIDERIIEFPWLIASLPTQSAIMLDAGSTVNHDFILDQAVFQNKDLTIMTLAPEIRSFWKRKISYVWADLRHNPFRENWFDVITCISTLEHVGMDNSIYTGDKTYQEDNRSSYQEVIREFKRILKPGGSLLLTVPYGVYENCGFQQVFDRAMLHNVLATFGGSVVEQQFYKYTNTGWQVADQTDCDHCRYFNIHATKKFDSDYAAAARAVACLHLIRS